VIGVTTLVNREAIGMMRNKPYDMMVDMNNLILICTRDKSALLRNIGTDYRPR
jgi:hypothetical protein